MPELKLAAIEVKPGAALESQSGLAMLRPRIYGAYMDASGPRRVAAIVMHPTSNFMGHYLIEPLARRGVTCMGLNSRYSNNDAMLLMERVIQDLGAGVKFLREAGYAKIVLIGNSGGASLVSFYQAQAEHFTCTVFRGLRSVGSRRGRLPASGWPRALRSASRPSPAACRVARPFGDRRIGSNRCRFRARHLQSPQRPPFTAEFLKEFRAAQRRRRESIRKLGVRTLAIPARALGQSPRIRHSSSTVPTRSRAAWISRSMLTTASQVRSGLREERQLRCERDVALHVATRVPLAMVVSLASRRAGQPRAHTGSSAAFLPIRPMLRHSRARAMHGLKRGRGASGTIDVRAATIIFPGSRSWSRRWLTSWRRGGTSYEDLRRRGRRYRRRSRSEACRRGARCQCRRAWRTSRSDPAKRPRTERRRRRADIPSAGSRGASNLGSAASGLHDAQGSRDRADVAAASPAPAPETAVVTAINGIPWWYFCREGGRFEGTRRGLDPDGAMLAALDATHLVGCVVHAAAEVIAPGVVHHTGGRDFILGEIDGTMTSRLQALAEALEGARLHAPLSRRIRDDIWTKLIGNTSYNPVAALTGALMNEINANPRLIELLRRMMIEGMQVAESLGARITVTLEERFALARKLGAAKISMLQDLERGRALEIDAIVTAVSELGRKTGVPTPDDRRCGGARFASACGISRPHFDNDMEGRATLLVAPLVWENRHASQSVAEQFLFRSDHGNS